MAPHPALVSPTVRKETSVSAHRTNNNSASLARGLGVLGAVVAVGLTLTACGGGAGAADTPAAASTASTAPDDGGAGGSGGSGAAQRTLPGASGEVAAVNGDIAQVQGDGTQTAVTWTSSTTVTQQVAGSFADVTVGACVSAFSASADDAASTGAGNTDSSNTDSNGPIAATTVSITPAGDDGTCGGARGGMAGGSSGGERPSGMPTDLPTDMPTDMPTDLPSGFPGSGDGSGRQSMASAGVFGTVTAVSDTGFTVEQTAFTRPGQDASADPETTTREVTVSSDTTYTTTAAGDTSAIAVGQCLTALGTEDDSGMITADSIALTVKGENGCTSRLGGGFSGGGFPGGGSGARGQGGTDD